MVKLFFWKKIIIFSFLFEGIANGLKLRMRIMDKLIVIQYNDGLISILIQLFIRIVNVFIEEKMTKKLMCFLQIHQMFHVILYLIQ
jgi:hypothetical protein